ncbi:hypothetical protein, partial [Novosphingobium mangrovi (ex Huang et al. 2023)]
PPRQTSLAAPKGTTLSNGWFLHRRAQQIAGAPLAWFVTALHTPASQQSHERSKARSTDFVHRFACW